MLALRRSPPISVVTTNVLHDDNIVVVIEVPRGANKFYMANIRDVWVKMRDLGGIPYRGIGTGVQRIQRECDEHGIRVEFQNLEKEEQFTVVFYRP